MKQKQKHRHIWKYIGDTGVRVCESPFGIGGCGRIEIKDDEGVWFKSNE